MVKETWVIYPAGLGLLVHPTFRRDVREIAGCADAIYLYVSEGETIRYGDTEIAADAIDIIHDHGLGVIVATDFGGLNATINPGMHHLLHRETWVKDPEGKTVQKCCVNNPQFRSAAEEFYTKFFDKYQVEGMALDEPQPARCVCADCCRKFGDTIGGDLREADQSISGKFAEDSIIDYFSTICQMAKARGARTACAVLPFDVTGFYRELCSLENLDIFGTDPYWLQRGRDVAWVGEMTKRFKQLCKDGNKDCLIVIQGFLVSSGREQEIYEAGRIAAENGADILLGWYHWRGTENPELTWDTTFRMLRDSKAAQ